MNRAAAVPEVTGKFVPPGLWGLAWPSAAQFAMQSLVGLVDFLIVSHLGGDAVAGVGVATQIFFFQFALFQAVNVGTVAMVARAVGARDADEADRVLRGSLVLGALLGLACTAVIPLARPLVAAFGVTPGVAVVGAGYLSVAFAFSVPVSVGFVFYNALRGAGDVVTALKIGLVINALNLVGDYALVFGELGAPRLGVVGAAWASGLSTLAGLSLTLWLWLGDRLVLRRTAWVRGLDADLARRLIRLGIPTALEGAIFNVGILLFTGFMAGFGTAAVAAYFIGVRLLSFSFVPGVAFSVAASTLVGQHLGAEQPDEASAAGYRACRGAVVVMALMGASIAALAETLTGWFGATGAETVRLATRFMWILALAQPLMAVEFSLGGALRGAGDTRFPLVSVMAGLFGGRLLLAYLVVNLIGGSVIMVWLCLLADWAIKATLLLWRFSGGTWKTIQV